MAKINAYKKTEDFSYTLGAFPTIELLKSRIDLVEHVYLSDKYAKMDQVMQLLKNTNIPCTLAPKQIERFTKGTKHLVVAQFRKEFSQTLSDNSPHLVLDNISDMGNLGTIMRTAIGLGVKDIALVGETCDIWNPKVIRASMGAIFKANIQHFDALNQYKSRASSHHMYAFLLNNQATPLTRTSFQHPYALIFGNEGSGLGVEYSTDESIAPVYIEQSEDVDSLNLQSAVSIGLYEATKN